MARRSVILHLLGFPGTGKLTVARALAASRPPEDPLVVLDNHLTGDPILAVVASDGIGPIDPRVWTYVTEIRDVVLRAVRDLAAPETSFVFTNVVVEGDGSDPISRLRRLADDRDARYVPVVLHCSPDERARRVVAGERRQRRKWIDADAVAAFVERSTLVRPGGVEVLDVDTTDQSPEQSAAAVAALVWPDPSPDGPDG